ncbi:hypothetical protein LCGC14_0340070 [marine sediment metagenome]|uniref:Uncharacterized protein n=1 Tax=marine sediment metagenome TaxID=412755 RepID=A0A0F9TDW1_9ZZZZ|nr:hypothetical protein [Phycisphaerae bacterium]HDZ44566.1 hypothetical protein [Phycisphaerae bacterium]
MEAISYVVFIVLAGLAAMAIVSVLRGFLERRRPPKPAGAVKPFIDFPPPEAVVRTPGVSRVGTFALVWATLNLGGIVTWLATGFGMQDRMAGVSDMVRVTAVGYFAIASILAGMGGMLMLSGKADGRRILSWAGFLFVMIVMMGFGISLVVWGSKEAALADRQLAATAAIVLFVHLVVDTGLAAAAQRVGLPAKPMAVVGGEGADQ